MQARLEKNQTEKQARLEKNQAEMQEKLEENQAKTDEYLEKIMNLLKKNWNSAPSVVNLRFPEKYSDSHSEKPDSNCPIDKLNQW